MSVDLGPLDRLAELAEGLAGPWSARAAGSTTVGRERALLRLAGVSGLDRDGRPLAWAVVDRYLAGRPDRLAAGVLLPFAMAAVEYDLGPQEVALDVAAGAIDLALEAELLAEPDRRAVAEAEARRFGTAALDRIDANRTARRELADLLGDPPRPWVGTTLDEPVASDAVRETTALVASGVDLIRVTIPAGRELSDRLQDVGRPIDRWRPRTSGIDLPTDDPNTLAPAGSQRGIGMLRAAADEAAAQRGAYVRLASVAPALSAPEQAAVAAFERIDLVEADPMGEIVSAGIDPDRALADHAFAGRLLARAGGLVLVEAGPLVVGPDFARGQAAEPAMLAGRALALQLVAISFARAAGLPAGQVVLAAAPGWLQDDPAAGPRVLANVLLRRRLWPDSPIALVEPTLAGEAADVWPLLVSATVATGGGTALVLARPVGAGRHDAISTIRLAAQVGAGIGDATAEAALTGSALDYAQRTSEAALATLERLRDDGWRAVLGQPPVGPPRDRLGADAVVERAEPFDPFGADEPVTAGLG